MKTDIINDKPHLVFQKGDEKELAMFWGSHYAYKDLSGYWKGSRHDKINSGTLVDCENGVLIAIPQPSIDDLKIGDTFLFDEARGPRKLVFKDDFKNKEIKKIRLISRGAGVPLRSEDEPTN